MHSQQSRAAAIEAERVAPPRITGASCPIPWWKRLTLLTFLFFLIKGLAWLIVPGIIIWWRSVSG